MYEVSDAKIIKYEFEVPIKRNAKAIWSEMINEIDLWWMSDFRALSEDSKVTFDAKKGGQLLESAKDGSTLEWYRVQMVCPEKSLYLVGNIAPDWGGPTTSMLKLSLEDRDDGGVLIVSDALLGSVTEASAKSAEDGWKRLFVDGLKAHVERKL